MKQSKLDSDLPDIPPLSPISMHAMRCSPHFRSRVDFGSIAEKARNVEARILLKTALQRLPIATYQAQLYQDGSASNSRVSTILWKPSWARRFEEQDHAGRVTQMKQSQRQLEAEHRFLTATHLALTNRPPLPDFSLPRPRPFVTSLQGLLEREWKKNYGFVLTLDGSCFRCCKHERHWPDQGCGSQRGAMARYV